MSKRLLLFYAATAALLMVLLSCSVSKQINKQANLLLLKDSVISTGHIGISIYEPAASSYWYNYNADKYFVPASNTKLFSLYAGMKYLGNSLVGIRYQNFSDTSITLFPTGDPTFLHPDFVNQPVLAFLHKQQKSIYVNNSFKEDALGKGWAWDDYNDSYMVERNAMPIFGNTVRFQLNDLKFTDSKSVDLNWNIIPQFFKDSVADHFVLPYKIIAEGQMQDSDLSKITLSHFSIERNFNSNNFSLKASGSKITEQEIPFITNGINTTKQILKTSFGLKIINGWQADNGLYPGIPAHLQLQTIKSQPSDSLFKPMMYNSDNFFAEQTLLMASNEHLGFMNDEAIIDTLLKTDLKDIPQKPSWVDGSGLSRYNLFTPQSFVYIINKMKNDFGLERLENILPTGGSGTFKNYYVADSSFIYAKTGSLTGVVALSGILITKKKKLLLFSVLTNNFKGRATLVRRAVEKFIQQLRNKY